MPSPFTSSLSRRERQIMDVVYERGQASAADIQAALPDPPSNSAVRALLRILETKGHLRHEKQGAQYIYFPTQPHNQAARSALAQVVKTFFDNSIERTVATLLSSKEARLTDVELERLTALIAQARQEEETR